MTVDVPSPLPPDDADAWYAPDVQAQYEPHPGVVATIRETEAGFDYDVREPVLGADGEVGMEQIRDHFSTAGRRRPLTREGAVERAEHGFEPKYERVLDRLLDASTATRRRVNYHALCELRVLEAVTPLALDDRIEIVDTGDDTVDEAGEGPHLVVHTENFAPATTEFAADTDFVGRIAGERLTRYTVPFCGFGVEVVVYREHLLGSDRFTTKYAVLEPDLLPGDEALIDECKSRIWEANVERVVDDPRTFVGNRARQFLSRRLTARNTRAWVDAATYRMKRALAEYDLAVPPVDSRFAEDRLDDLVYYVLRDYVGEHILTVPIRDPHLEDIEANRVGERVKVVPRTDIVGAGGDGVGTGRDGRVPTNLTFDEETTFVNVVTQLAASDGTELNASTPSAKVNLSPPSVDETIRCAVALPVISEDGPHVSIRKQSADALTPIDLVQNGALSTEVVTLLWLLYEYHGIALFSGPTGVGKTTLMNAHMPFIPYDDRPISIDEGSREVRLPHETGVSLTTRDHENEYKRITMADLMTETNYLNPDVEVIAEINTPASFETFAETLNTGHGVIGTTHAEDVETLVNRVVEQGLPPYLLREIDLVVFPRHVDGERYVGEVVELVSADDYEDVSGRCGVVEKDDTEIHWNTVAWRDTSGEFHLDYAHPQLGDDSRRVGLTTFDRLAARTDRDVEAVEAEFHRKHRYVQYLVREGVEDVETLFDFLADLRTDEAATVERASRQLERAERSERDGRDEQDEWDATVATDGGEG
ncbi:Type IV secretory pathway ATPase VirB11/Archaellum biosynthesis ATPase [Halogranum rubrum]|uniref:Type IV secretory pathway ATPase VirB11/Archaellum biosynthesis ATPase n=1 Tax=Halogranum rubrum TaxID=553466 RepID=A0A1I4E7D6_9EURY|nr:type II/IV secretion system ATPase subunit [Halogranum rubrum]SFL00081.1 Type IV secretory pathway ATPase VirB11/Archaellum biosynthesis ATPase [Halogranum rubrum]